MHQPHRRRLLRQCSQILALALLVLKAGPAWTQTPPEDGPSDSVGVAGPSQARSEALLSLFKAVEAKRKEVNGQRKALTQAKDAVTRKSLESDLERLLEELEDIESKFAETAVGVDVSLFREREKVPFSWEQTLGRILEPILAEVEEATATSRKMASLKEEQARFAEQQEVSEVALRNLQKLEKGVEESQLQSALGVLQKRWEKRRILATNQANAARLRLEEMASNQQGMTDYARKFLSTRGVNLVLGLGAAALVFLLVRLSFGLLRERKGTAGLRTRLVSVLASVLSVLGAMATLLVFFSAAGDLFLVGIVLVFLLGAGWAGVRLLPEFVESLRLILNIGMVKEGQRIVFDDIPWVVQRLGFSCRLENPRLDQAVLELPVRKLVGLHSRPFCEDEAVFPTQRGDWVSMDDGVIGQIKVQNPSGTIIEEPGGARHAYSTVSLLERTTKILSSATFRIETRFGIDYKHQAVATQEVPTWFQTALELELPKVVGENEIVGIHVAFAEAGASSLDYEIEVDMAGAAAPKLQKIQFALQRILVETCTDKALEIPFPQVTMHRASA